MNRNVEVKYNLYKNYYARTAIQFSTHVHAMIAAAISRGPQRRLWFHPPDRTSERDPQDDSHGEQSPKRAAPFVQWASRTRSCNTRTTRDPLTSWIVRSPFDGRSATRVRSGKPPPCLRRHAGRCATICTRDAECFLAGAPRPSLCHSGAESPYNLFTGR